MYKSFKMSLNIKKLVPHIISIVVIVLLNIIYFYPQIEGLKVQQSDTVESQYMANEARSYQSESGEIVLWTNSMFGGMPTYQISSPAKSNYLNKVGRKLMLGFDRPIGYFVFGMLAFYFLLILLKVDPILSLVGAIMFGFSTNNFILFEAGHNTKVWTIMSSSLVIAGTILTLNKKYLIGFTIFAFGLGLNIGGNHPQMTYYLAMILAILVIAYFARSIKEKDFLHLVKVSAVFLIGGALAVGTSASKLWTTYEYSKDTMRGKPILTAQDQNSSSAVEGLAYDYAMQWSNTSMDLLAFIIPHSVGGGSGEWLESDTGLARVLGQRRSFQAPTYWGGLPFTSGPTYFGALVMFLFVFGGFVLKGPLKWWLLSATIFTFLLSMGKHFSILNKPIFDYLPWYNKFRTPNSILSVTAVIIPILSILGLNFLNSLKKEEKPSLLKPLYFSFAITGGFCLIMALLGGSLFSFANEAGDGRYSNFIDALIDQRRDMLFSSSMRSFFLIAIGFLLIWLHIKGKIKSNVLFILIGLATLIDLYGIGKKYLEKSDFVRPNQYEQNFEPRPVDLQILQDPDPYYRVYDGSVNTFNTASSSYFHKSIGGYHPAKLQRYQDLIERHISTGNQKVFNMLNTKYYISADASGNPTAQLNNQALGNAWFVSTIQLVESADQEIAALSTFNPSENAIVHSEFSSLGIKSNYQKNGTINLTTYSPNKLTYTSSSTSDQFAVFSDIWYGPEKGWSAYIDGNKVKYPRANYLLRSLPIPAGNHEIIFEFKPKSYFIGETISLISSLLILGLVLYLLFLFFQSTKMNNTLIKD